MRLVSQPPLFSTPRQPRYREPEPEHIYAAVLALRARGIRIWRGGRTTHIVNGKRLTDRQLLSMAQQ